MYPRSIARLIGLNSADNLVDTSNVSAKPSGSLLERVQALLEARKVGGVFVIKKNVVSNTITMAGIDLTGISTGELAVEDVILQTDGTGLAGGTNLLIVGNNALGQVAILSESVSNLGPNITKNLDTASVGKQRCVLESGKKLSIRSTDADCTGTGTMDVYMKFRRLTPGATISAV